MLSKGNAKLIKSLQLKKYRLKEKLFLVEGAKTVLETLKSAYSISKLIVTDKFYESYNSEIPESVDFQIVSGSELSRLSDVKTNEEALAIVQIPVPATMANTADQLCLALDDIRDPGNLGAIIRIADWYGIRQIIASPSSTDFYNPKTIRASMGSFLRVNYHVIDLPAFFKDNTQFHVYGALLSGDNAHDTVVRSPACLVIGNESNGISSEVQKLVQHAVTIPRYGAAESLNAAMATAILCDNFVRFLKK